MNGIEDQNTPIDISTNPVGSLPQGIMPPTEQPDYTKTESEAVVEEGNVGVHGVHNKLQVDMSFEDYFPSIELTDTEKDNITAWLKKDLASCVRNVNKHKEEWALWRAVYALEYMDRLLPDIGIDSDYCSGLLTEKVLEAMDRMKRAVFGVNPMFIVNSELSRKRVSVEFTNRAEWVMENLLVKRLKLKSRLRDELMFDYVMDGSAILEADTMFTKTSARSFKTYTTLEEFEMDADRVVDKGVVDEARVSLVNGVPVRLLVESDVMEDDGVTVYRVNKSDHLIPPNIYSDDDVQFRGRRLYLSKADLLMMSESDVGWYDRDDVDKIIDAKTLRMTPTKEGSVVKLNETTEDDTYMLRYGEDLNEGHTYPYSEFFSVYRVTCKYGYKTGSDPKGRIPKFCVFDYSPEGNVLLRASVYPHLVEQKNWFHMKLGYLPNSYYGFGFGKRVYGDDRLESNSITLFFESSVMAGFSPMITKDPETGGRFPFPTGFGPAKVGYANEVGDVQMLRQSPPVPYLVSVLSPMLRNRSENKTGITALVQGRAESSDPRSPAAKTQMLLNEASISLDMMVSDWNNTGWNSLANYMWGAMYEVSSYLIGVKNADSAFGGLVVKELPENPEGVLSLSELTYDLLWESQASSDVLNKEYRKSSFLQMFQFFVPLLEKMATSNPEQFRVYFMRWMTYAARVFDVPGAKQLLPMLEDMPNVENGAMVNILRGLSQNIRANRNSMGLELGATTQQPQEELEQGAGGMPV